MITYWFYYEGTLVIKNKTLNRGRSSKWLRQTIRGTRKPTIIGTSNKTEATLLEVILFFIM